MAFNYCNDRGAVAFVKKFHSDCVKLGAKVNAPAEFILAVAASESTYGRLGRTVKYRNYFSMETASDNPSIPYAIAYHILAEHCVNG